MNWHKSANFPLLQHLSCNRRLTLPHCLIWFGAYWGYLWPSGFNPHQTLNQEYPHREFHFSAPTGCKSACSVSQEISQRLFLAAGITLHKPSPQTRGAIWRGSFQGHLQANQKEFFLIWTYPLYLSGCLFIDPALQWSPEDENLLSLFLQQAGRWQQLSSLREKADLCELKTRMKSGKFCRWWAWPGTGERTRTSKSDGSKHSALSQLSYFLRSKSHFRQPNSLQKEWHLWVCPWITQGGGRQRVGLWGAVSPTAGCALSPCCCWIRHFIWAEQTCKNMWISLQQHSVWKSSCWFSILTLSCSTADLVNIAKLKEDCNKPLSANQIAWLITV